MYKTVVYKGDEYLGDVEIYPPQVLVGGEGGGVGNNCFNEEKRVIDEILSQEIRISHFSPPSERCPPLAVLHTITSTTCTTTTSSSSSTSSSLGGGGGGGICFKMEAKNLDNNSPLHALHSSCIQDNKTAVMPLGGEEIHLVAMYSKNAERQYPCFWGFSVDAGLYDSCLVMLNLRCLGIVFDLDETLIVANTMRSFEDRIDALQRKVNTEVDPQRVSGMVAEIKRYQDDKSLLKQYVEIDQVVDNGKVIKSQSEAVPPLSDNHQPMARPLIRLQDKNIILTRINPQIRDTSVLVRVRPAWEDLRNYLTAKGRKRFEVYVCTMAERDYALEMWRLLDPESKLINPKELLARIVCVKAGSRKSLFNVFQDGICDPKMALVIDDRLKVWDEKDQPRVHVVPAFAPYYAPQAEANNTIPVLCVARNVACNVRGGFFKDFDEVLLQKIPEISYEDDISVIPSPPDVSSYLVSEDDSSAYNGNKDPLSFDGMADNEVERRLKEAVSTSTTTPLTVSSIDPRLVSSLQYAIASSSSVTMPTSQPPMPYSSLQFPQTASMVKPLGQIVPSEPRLPSSPAREEGEVPESELDPDTRRRLLILQHGQDTRDNPPNEAFPVRPLVQAPVPRVQSHGSWVQVEEEMSPRQVNRIPPREFPLDPEPLCGEKPRTLTPFFSKMENPIPPMLHENQRLPKETHFRDDRLRSNHAAIPNYHSFSEGDEISSQSSTGSRELDKESEGAALSAETPVELLEEIALKLGTKVEYRPSLVNNWDLQFSIEVWFAGEKVGEGTGRTRREARHVAAEGSVNNLANIYMSRTRPDFSLMDMVSNGYSSLNENGFLSNANPFCNQPLPKDELVSFSAPSEPSRLLDPRLAGSEKPMGSVTALKELCMTEGLGVNYLAQTPISASAAPNGEIHAQVEIDGQVFGNGIGSTWEEAKMQAAENALGSLKAMLGQYPPKRQGSPRIMPGMPNKRFRPEFPRMMQRMPPSGRYARNAPPVP